MKKRAMSDEKCPKCGAGAREGETIHEQRRFHCGTAANAEDVLWTGNLCYRNQIRQLRAENENLRRAGTVMEQANTQFAAEFVASNATIAELRAKNERLRDGLAEFPCCSCRGTGEQIADTGRHVVSCDMCDGSGKCPDATELLDDTRQTPRSFTMTTDETTPETNVTIGMLEELLSTANRIVLKEKTLCGGAKKYKDWYAAAALATGIVLGEVRRLIPPRIPTPTPVPAPKFKERDWVQHKNSGAIWRIVGLSATSVPLMYRVESADGLVGDMYEEFLLPIPPKPDKVQAGYRLRGDVKVADGSEPFIIAFGVNAGLVATCTVDMTVFGGRRWIVELDPVCPHCQDTHVCQHCQHYKANAT